MIKYEMELSNIAAQHIAKIITGDVFITYVFFNRTNPPADHEAWMLEVKLSNGHAMSLWMEGSIISKVTDYVEADGRRLLGDHNKIHVLASVSPEDFNTLNGIVMDAFTQALPA